MPDPLFAAVEAAQGAKPWGRFLDAGTGWHSLEWIQTLDTERWTAVTIDLSRMLEMRPHFSRTMRPIDQLVLGSWDDPELLKDQKFDAILLDYLIGAMDVFTPYKQDLILPRLMQHLQPEGRIYLIGLEPPTEAPERKHELLRELDQFKDACRLLSGARAYREYPAAWVERRMVEAGLQVLSVEHFTRTLRQRFVASRTKACRQHIAQITPPALQEGLRRKLEQLEAALLPFARSAGGIRYGSNYVMVAQAA